MHVQQPPRPGALVQVVDILRHDQQIALPCRIQLGQRTMRGIGLDPGERRRVALAIPLAELALVAADGAWRVEPGDFDLFVDAGPGSRLATAFTVAG